MKFSYDWLQSYFKKKLPEPEKLAELLSDHFANVEEVKKEGGDFVLDIEVRPNRAADCFCHWGVAREVATILALRMKNQESKIREDKKVKAKDLIKVVVKEKKACPRYSARVIQGVRVGPSPAWLKERLAACGLQSINNIVDACNYAMLETNQPLHAFDFEKISGQTIMVRFAKNGEKLLTLDDKTYELEGDILVIADGEKPLAIAGIKGGQSSGINPKTKTIVLEAANFNHLTIRRASQKLKLKTDASWRFEHGLDANLTQIGLNQAAAIINQVAGGQVAQGLVDFYPRRRRPKIIKLAMGLVNDLLGVKIPVVRAKAILRSLDFKTKPSRKYLLVQPPTIRTDALLPEDLVEEIGRFYGYQNIVERFPEVRLSPPLENRDLFWGEKARDLMVQADFAEVWNYSFARKGELELENPLDQNRPYLVSSLWPNLLNNVALNSPYFEKGKIFELGKVFLKKGEERRLAAAIWGKGSQGFWELKGAAESLLEKSGVGKFKWRENVRNNFEIIVERTPVGVLQEQDAVWLLEINFEKLLPWFSRNKEYQPLAKNPAAKRDLAILVPEKTRSAGVEKIVSAQKIPYLSKIELFDVYRGPKLPPGKKGLAFHFFFQSLEKTLTAEEVNMSLEKIINILEKKEWRVRK